MTAVLTRGQQDFARFSFPVIKSAPDSNGDLRVYGICTNDALDRDLERIDMHASKQWLETWMDTGANIRLQHDAKRPIGKGVQLDFRPEGHYLTAIVVDRDAADLVRKGVLTAYSLGVSRPWFRPDPTGKAVRVITGRSDGATEVSEVSLVDRPSNADCDITILDKVTKTVNGFIATAGSRNPALRALVLADLHSPDPDRRVTAEEILAGGLV